MDHTARSRRIACDPSPDDKTRACEAEPEGECGLEAPSRRRVVGCDKVSIMFRWSPVFNLMGRQPPCISRGGGEGDPAASMRPGALERFKSGSWAFACGMSPHQPRKIRSGGDKRENAGSPSTAGGAKKKLQILLLVPQEPHVSNARFCGISQPDEPHGMQCPSATYRTVL